MESFANTFGMMFIAFFITSILYGIAILMVFQYYRLFGARDDLKVRILVGVMGFLATVQVATFAAWAYEDVINRFGEFNRLDSMPRTAIVQLLAIYLVGFSSQCFFASRIWFLSKHNIWLTAPILILALVQISAGIAQTTLSAVGGTFSNLVHTERVTSLQSAATAACDLAITIVLCFVLNSSRTGIKTTDTILDRMILYAINRGVATSVAAILNLSLFIWKPTAMIFMVPLLPSSQLYVMSVVATLNSRQSLRDARRPTESGSMQLSSRQATSTPTAKHVNPENGGVRITTSVVTWVPENDSVDEKDDDGSKSHEKASPITGSDSV